MSDDTKRRMVISLNVAMSNKETVQVGHKTVLERGIDLVHRKVLADLMPRYDSRFNLLDFDVLYGTLIHDLKILA